MKPSVDLSLSTEDGGRKNPTWTSSIATTTAVSSKATTVHRRAGKKSQRHRGDSRQEAYSKKGTNKQRAEYVPREPLSEQFVMILRRLRPILVRCASIAVTLSSSLATKVVKTIISFCPQKERFWFIIPMLCIGMDLFFLAACIICSIIGKLVYITFLLHKLAILELLEFDSATISYSLICFYPIIINASKDFFPLEEYWTVFFRWFVIDRLLCRPILMKNTYLNRIRHEHRKKLGLTTERGFSLSTRSIARLILRLRRKIEETERVSMANQILLILRKIIPLILMIELNVSRQGFLMSMSITERILLSYGFAVIRSGYLFSPLIWMAWTMQLTTIMFAPSSRFWAYCLLSVGLSAIRLSHYTASMEDIDGLYVPCDVDEQKPDPKQKID